MKKALKLSRGKISLILIFFGLFGAKEGSGQHWTQTDLSLHPQQYEGSSPPDFIIDFLPNGPWGKDWIYGSWVDADSIGRYIAYRQNGTWNYPPVVGGLHLDKVSGLTEWGDTLVMVGTFSMIVPSYDTSVVLPSSGMMLWHGDSVWVDTNCNTGIDVDARGDTLLVSGPSCYSEGPVDTGYVYYFQMTTDNRRTWQYPFSIVHPTKPGSLNPFGPVIRTEILSNGDIMVLNGPSSPGYEGIIRWDGIQWNSYDNVTFGGGGRAHDYEFFGQELYMGGSFSKDLSATAPGRTIARWDGQAWTEVGGGISEGTVMDIFVHDTLLYTRLNLGSPSLHKFGDVLIPFLAAWTGKKWCGVPFAFNNKVPLTFGFIKDTLYTCVIGPGDINGDPVQWLAYYDINLMDDPNLVCSTPGVGLNENSFHTNINIYPNPAYDELTIVLPSQARKAKIKILGLDGSVLIYRNLVGARHLLDLSRLQSGIYALSVQIEERIYFKKLIKE